MCATFLYLAVALKLSVGGCCGREVTHVVMRCEHEV